MNKIIKYHNLISTSNSFYIDKNILIIANNEGLILIANDKKFLICETKVYSFKYFKNVLFYQIVNGDELILYKNHVKKIIDGNFYLSSALIFKSLFFIRGKKNAVKTIYLFDELTLNFKTTHFAFLPDKVLQKNYFSYSLKSILKYNFLNKLLWQKHFTHDIAKIEVWNEKVVVIELYDAHTIIALSSDDGQLLWKQSGWLLHVYNNAIYMIYNPDSNILIVKKTDALSGSVINYDLSEILKQNQLLGETMQYTVVDNLIYFSFFYKKIVTIINLETLQLQWLHQIQTDASWIKEPRVEGNRLYVLDSDQTLHIFEKEE